MLSEQKLAIWNRFSRDGFGALIDDEPKLLAEALNHYATENDVAAPLHIASALLSFHSIGLDHEQGLPMGFIDDINCLVKRYVRAYFSTDVQSAQNFKTEVVNKIREFRL